MPNRGIRAILHVRIGATFWCFGLQAPAPAPARSSSCEAVPNTLTLSQNCKIKLKWMYIARLRTTVTFMIEYVCLSSMYVLMVQETEHA